MLRMVASASEESETDSSVSTPLRQPQPLGGTAAAALSQLESLQSKLQDLEEENLALRTEVCRSLGSKFVALDQKQMLKYNLCCKLIFFDLSRLVNSKETPSPMRRRSSS